MLSREPARYEQKFLSDCQNAWNDRSIRHIAKMDLELSAFRHMPAQVLSDAVKLKWLERCRALLRCLTVNKVKQVFFTDEKNFYLNPPVNTQNDRVWAKRKKKEVASTRLLTEREKFVPHLMVCASMCYGGKGWLHFVEEKAKVNADYYTTKLLPNPVEDGRHTLPGQFIFQ